MNTVKSLHAEWAKKIMPFDASQTQRQEMERAFYSGAFACFTHQLADIAALSDEDAEKAMQALQDELEDYFRTLAKATKDISRQ